MSIMLRVASLLFVLVALTAASEERLSDLHRLSATLEDIMDRLDRLERRMASQEAMGPVESKVVVPSAREPLGILDDYDNT